MPTARRPLPRASGAKGNSCTRTGRFGRRRKRTLCPASGLVHVLSDWAPRREIIDAVFPSRRGLLPSVRSLIDFLVERFQQI